MRRQLEASKPLGKRLWQARVRARIPQQQNVLEPRQAPGDDYPELARKVRSGARDNAEAQAARRYWPRLFGTDASTPPPVPFSTTARPSCAPPWPALSSPPACTPPRASTTTI